MALNASSKLRPKVIALQKRGAAMILERTATAAANGSLPEKPAPETYRVRLRITTKRTADST